MRYLPVVLAAACASACAAPLTVAAQQPPAPDGERTIQVSARAAVQRAPDRAVVRLAVENVAETAADAMSRNAATMDRVLAALRGLGIPSDRIQTTRVAVHPRYEQRRPADAEPRIIGYQAVNQVSVRVDDVGRVGRVIDEAVRAGANRVTGVQFELSDPESAYHDALRLAIARARAEAEVAADALGERLGPAIRVSTDGFAQPMPRLAVEAARVMDAPTPVEPGELDVHATVSIVFRLGS